MARLEQWSHRRGRSYEKGDVSGGDHHSSNFDRFDARRIDPSKYFAHLEEEVERKELSSAKSYDKGATRVILRYGIPNDCRNKKTLFICGSSCPK